MIYEVIINFSLEDDLYERLPNEVSEEDCNEELIYDNKKAITEIFTEKIRELKNIYPYLNTIQTNDYDFNTNEDNKYYGSFESNISIEKEALIKEIQKAIDGIEYKGQTVYYTLEHQATNWEPADYKEIEIDYITCVTIKNIEVEIYK